MRTDPETERKILELAGLSPGQEKPAASKYHNKKTEIDGIVFDSKREANRWVELQYMEKAGAISGLSRQVPFKLEVNGILVCVYKSDFAYVEQGEYVVEDAKGMKTDVYRIKKRLMWACLGIEIRES
jgi:hypothetical protein